MWRIWLFKDACFSFISNHPIISFTLLTFVLLVGEAVAEALAVDSQPSKIHDGFGLHEVASGTNSSEGFDIVAVHNLGGHSTRSWCSDSPRTSLLSDHLHWNITEARILSYGFSSQRTLREIAMHLIIDLSAKREREVARPIIFIGHGFGGNVIKQAIIYSRTSQNYRHRAIFDSARGFLFFATRHSGNYYDAIPTIFRWYAFATSYLLRKFDVMPETAGVVALAQDADIERSNIQFNQHKKGFRITCFYEGLPIRALGFKLVPDDAAIMREFESVSLHKNHHDMIKFPSRDDPDYLRVLTYLQSMKRDPTHEPILEPISLETHDIPLGPLSENSVKALCLDGGGIRGLSSLLAVKDLMYDIKRKKGLKDLPKPCNIFDIICGTSTGGLIAIMLGRLRMDVDSCIIAYEKLSREIFERKGWQYWVGLVSVARDGVRALRGNPWYDSEGLEKAIMEILRQRLPENEPELVDQNVRGVPLIDPLEGCCRSFVCAIDADNTDKCVRLRTYRVPNEQLDEKITNCTIVDAARATSAAPLFFPPMKIGSTRFFDGALRNNNPVLELVKETRGPLGGSDIKVLVSIGTGKPKRSTHRTDALGLIHTLSEMATSTEQHHLEISNDPLLRGRYFRFNVEDCLSEIGIDSWDKLPEVRRLTRAYLDSENTKTVIDRCAGLLCL